MPSTPVILLIVAVVLLGLATIGVGAPRFSLGWAGMAFFVLSVLIAGHK